MGAVVTGGGNDDPVLARRARMERLATTGQRLGYTFLLAAMVAFMVGAVRGFTTPVATVVVAALAAGSAFLLPAIIVGFGVRAAERADRGLDSGH